MTSTTLTYSNLTLDQAARIAQIVADELGSRAETRNSHHVGRVTDAQRQGAVAAQAPIEQDGSAIAAVTSKAQLANAVGVEPLPSFNPKPGPLNPEAADGQPSIPSDDTAGAKSDGLQSVVDRVGQEPGGIHCQSSQAVTHSRERKPLRPYCQSPDDLTKCAGRGREHCHACTKAMAQSEAA